jgi:glutamate formiminotransferase/formiminotetrahydrofolate cyclodeaminase
MRVTGSELVGLVPLKSILDAGKYFLAKQKRSVGISEDEIIKIAVKSMGLDELTPFDPKKKIIEYVMQDQSSKNLIDMNLVAFANETASESPAPGGGSISAYVGALGASLAIMVANLSSHKKGWDDQWGYFSMYAEKGQVIKDELLKLVDEDTNAFNKIMNAFGLPKNSDEEKQTRSKAIQDATLYATQIPLKTMQVCFSGYDIAQAMVEKGNPNSVTDAGVGALCIRTAIYGAYLNVKINASGLKDKIIADAMVLEATEILDKSNAKEQEIMIATLARM